MICIRGAGPYLTWVSRFTLGLNVKADDAATASKSILHIAEKNNSRCSTLPALLVTLAKDSCLLERSSGLFVTR